MNLNMWPFSVDIQTYGLFQWIYICGLFVITIFSSFFFPLCKSFCHTAIENLSDPIGYLLDFTNPYYTALAGNMKACAKKDNSFW
jgi:hypothetical protein